MWPSGRTGRGLRRVPPGRPRVPLTAAGREAYLSAQLPGYSAFRYLNRSYGPRYHLYALGFERMFYLADGEMDGDWFGRGRYADVLALKDDPEALRRHLFALGADHLLVHIRKARRVAGRPTPPAELVAFADDEVRLFRLR